MASFVTPRYIMQSQKSTYVDSRWSNQTPATLSSFTVVSKVHDETKVTASNPNWRIAVVKKQNAGLPYSRRVVPYAFPYVIKGESFTPQPGGHRIVGKDVSYKMPGNQTSLVIPEDTSLRDRALAALKRKINDSVGQAKVMVPAAELREMRGLIKNQADLSHSLVTALLDIRKTKGASAYKYVADRWLTYSFAMSPMISDVQSISNAIADHMLGLSNTTRRFAGTASKDWLSVDKYVGETGLYGASITCTRTRYHSLSYTYTAGISTEVSAANDYGLLSHLGIGVDQIVPSLWALSAYSWLVDYFTTTGAYLEDVFTTQPFTTVYVSLSRKYDLVQDFDPVYNPSPGTLVTTTMKDHGGMRVVDFRRTIEGSIPSRSWRFKSADEIGINAVKRLLNLSSLLVSRR